MSRVWVVLGSLFALGWAVAAVVAVYDGPLRAMREPAPPAGCVGPTTGEAFQPAAGGVGPQPQFLRALGDPTMSGQARWTCEFDAAPKAFDINGDGRDEIIAYNNDTSVYVFDPDNGHVLATLPTKYPYGWYIERILNGVEAAQLRPGEPASIVVADHAAYVTVWRFVPARSDPDHFVFHKEWERRMDACFGNPGMDAKPTLADVDGDGTTEILVQTEEMGFFALNADGSTRWHQCWAGGNSAPVVDDLEGHGKLQAVIASDSGFVSILDANNGQPMWTFDATKYGIKPASISTSPTIADIDGKAPKEILFTTREAPSPDNSTFPQDHMGIFAIHRNLTTWQGELVWMRQPEWANPLSYAQLVASDPDQDGQADIFGVDWNTIGHNPGDWQVLGPAHVFRLAANGTDVWVKTIDSLWSNKDVLLEDLDHDGAPDVLVNGVDNGQDGFWRLDAGTGEPVGFFPVAPWLVMRAPLYVSLHHDDQTQLVFPAAPSDPKDVRGALLVYQVPR